MRSSLRLVANVRGYVGLLLVVEALTLVVFAVLLSVPQIPVSAFVRDVLIGNVVYLWPILIMLSRGWADRSDRAWSWCIAAGAACFLIGNLLYVLWVVNLEVPPFPSWVDAAYLSV